MDHPIIIEPMINPLRPIRADEIKPLPGRAGNRHKFSGGDLLAQRCETVRHDQIADRQPDIDCDLAGMDGGIDAILDKPDLEPSRCGRIIAQQSFERGCIEGEICEKVLISGIGRPRDLRGINRAGADAGINLAIIEKQFQGQAGSGDDLPLSAADDRVGERRKEIDLEAECIAEIERERRGRKGKAARRG